MAGAAAVTLVIWVPSPSASRSPSPSVVLCFFLLLSTRDDDDDVPFGTAVTAGGDSATFYREALDSQSCKSVRGQSSSMNPEGLHPSEEISPNGTMLET